MKRVSRIARDPRRLRAWQEKGFLPPYVYGPASSGRGRVTYLEDWAFRIATRMCARAPRDVRRRFCHAFDTEFPPAFHPLSPDEAVHAFAQSPRRNSLWRATCVALARLGAEVPPFFFSIRVRELVLSNDGPILLAPPLSVVPERGRPGIDFWPLEQPLSLVIGHELR